MARHVPESSGLNVHTSHPATRVHRSRHASGPDRALSPWSFAISDQRDASVKQLPLQATPRSSAKGAPRSAVLVSTGFPYEPLTSLEHEEEEEEEDEEGVVRVQARVKSSSSRADGTELRDAANNQLDDMANRVGRSLACRAKQNRFYSSFRFQFRFLLQPLILY